MLYMMNISGLGLKNPHMCPDLESTFVYALFTIILLRDRYIYEYHTCIYCIGVVRVKPDNEPNRKLIMTTKTYSVIQSKIMDCINDQNSKTPIRSYSANSDCIRALLSVANDILTRDEFRRLYTECIEW